MLRRPPTVITLTAKDIAEYDKRREQQLHDEHKAKMEANYESPDSTQVTEEEHGKAKGPSARSRIMGHATQAGASTNRP